MGSKIMDAVDVKKITKELSASYEVRINVIRQLVDSTRQTLDAFRAKREALSGELRERLATSESLRKKDFDRMMADILATQRQREENVKMLLDRFQKEEEEMAVTLHTLLGKGERMRLRDFKKMLAKIRDGQLDRAREAGRTVDLELERMRHEVSSMLEAFRREREKVGTKWGAMISGTNFKLQNTEDE